MPLAEPTVAMNWPYELGQAVERQHLHDTVGGARGGPIAPSAASPNVLLFLDPDELGNEWGVRWYGDRLVLPTQGSPDGFGSSPNNEAVRTAAVRGRALRLFRGRAGTVVYLGEFALEEGHWRRVSPAPPGRSSGVTQFILRPVDALPSDHDAWCSAGGAVHPWVFTESSGTTHVEPGCAALWGGSARDPVVRRLTRTPAPTTRGGVQWCEACAADVIEDAGPDATTFRTFFRLQPPETIGGWTVGAYVESAADPTLVIPGADVRCGRADIRLGLGTSNRYLDDLVVAAAEVQQLEGFLETDRVELDDEELRDFLAYGIDRLAVAGFDVERPELQPLKLRLSARPVSEESRRGSLLDLPALMSFRWDVTSDGQPLSPEEIRLLVDAKSPVVWFRELWTELWPDDAQQALTIVDEMAGRSAAPETVQQAVSEADPSWESVPVDIDVSDPAACVHLLAKAGPLEVIRPPQQLRHRLRRYQLYGVSWIRRLERFNLGALLADDMGLGKTAQTIAVIAADIEEAASRDATLAPTLVICPMSVLKTWEDDIAKFAPSIRYRRHHGPNRPRGFRFTARDVDMVLTTYDLLNTDIVELGSIQWRRLVLDEAQNIKNPGAQRFKNATRVKAEHHLALSGTPVVNRLRDLWTISQVLNPGLLGPRATFEREYAEPIEAGLAPEREAHLRAAVAPLILRRLKTDRSINLGLPEKVERKTYCHLTEEQKSLYQATVEASLPRLRGATRFERQSSFRNILVQLKQICDHPLLVDKHHPRLHGRSGKLAVVDELLEQALDSEEKVLIFTEFVEMGKILAEHVEATHAVRSSFMYGDTPLSEREQLIDRLANDPDLRVLVLQLKVGGVGLNLTAASRVIHYDRWWNAAVEDQATDRVHRIGQTRGVMVDKLISVGTFEERVDRIIDQRGDLARRIVASRDMAATLAELPEAELRRLLLFSEEN